MEMQECGVERTDLIEMWGYFMVREYAHRRYGLNAHSAITEYFTNPGAPTFLNSWYAVAENRGDHLDKRFEANHIPACFLHDIIDNNTCNQNVTPSLSEATAVTDNIRGGGHRRDLLPARCRYNQPCHIDE
ncbi:hypothetical protein [Niabella drilacis]|nr:hypothetical protein [Niabella drilacis]